MTCQPQGEQPRLLLSESCQANRSHCAVKRMGPRLRKAPYFGKFGTLATGKEPLPWNTDCGSRSRGARDEAEEEKTTTTTTASARGNGPLGLFQRN